MLSELKTADKVVGIKQVLKALKEKKAIKVFVAQDADLRLTKPVTETCKKSGIQLTEVESMKELGQAVGIEVGASVAALVTR